MSDAQQDFSRKMVIVLHEQLGSWQLTNTVAHISAYLGNKMNQPFDTGKYFVSQDNVSFPRNSQYPIVALKASEKELRALMKNAIQSNLLWVIYTQDMIDLTDDEELAKQFAAKNSDAVQLLGIGMFGTKQELKPLTGTLPLWK